MCRLLAELTQTDLRLMAETVRRLEHHAGAPAVDIRLTADIQAQIHLKIRSLGLDPHDTHPKELYVALQNLAAVHENFLKKKFGYDKNKPSSEFAGSVEHIFNRLRFNRRSWLIRLSVLRRLLREQPPKQLVKALGYRTADSMLKREPVEVMLFFALQTEGAIWQQQFDKQLQKLSAVNFEERLIEAKTLNEPRYQALSKAWTLRHHSLVAGQPLTGTVFMLPTVATVKPGMLLLTLAMALKETTELQYVQSYLRHYQMESFFAKKLAPALRVRELQIIPVAGHSFSWQLVHKHFGSEHAVSHPALFQPHLQPEDLAYRRAEEILYRLEPALHFWHGAEFAGVMTGQGIVSFNLLDVLVNLVNDVPLSRQLSEHMRQSVWDELILRYLRLPAVEQSVVSGLAAHYSYAPSAVHDSEFL